MTDILFLTQRQASILGFIKAHIAERGWAPTIREIGNAVGLRSTSSVAHQMEVLEARGFVRLGAFGEPRAIAVVDGSTCPTCGRAA